MFNIGRPNKKASLELSVNAIVIVVLAMTLLGLGLAFVKGLFGNIGEISTSTFEKISEQLNKDLATSDSNIVFSKTRLEIDRGGKSLEGWGIKNDGSTQLKYGIKIKLVSCPDAADGTACDPLLIQNDVEKWFTYIKGDQKYTLGAAESHTKDVQIVVPRVNPGLYLISIIAYEGTWIDTCGEDPEECDIYEQTELFLTVA